MGILIHLLHVTVAIEMNKRKSKHIILVLFLMTGLTRSYGQEAMPLLAGTVTFKSSQNVYVKFPSTANIRIGDTLYFSKDSLIPALEVRNISSSSCVAKKLTPREINLSDQIYARQHSQPVVEPSKAVQVPKEEEKKVIAAVSAKPVAASPEQSRTQKINGRLAISSYSSFSDGPGKDAHRLRYTFTLNAKNLHGTRWSAESYLSFRHKVGDWQEVKNHLFQALKIYNLAVKYEFNQQDQIWFGRKINLNVSNIGAVDGIQYERKIKNMTYGAILGSRPDYSDYSFNINLMQAGLFMGHTVRNKTGDMSSTFALFEQENKFKTDRRFAYFQHSNTLLKNLMFFGSFELDLYKRSNGKPISTLSPSSIFLSMRYRINRKLALSASYDALKNVIYYESYKNFIDQIIEHEVRQGLRFSADFSPFQNVSVGATTGYRFQANRADPSKNGDLYISWYQVPLLKLSATASVTLLQTDYLEGSIIGLRMNKSILNGKWSAEASFRKVNYQYSGADEPLNQNIAGFNITCRFFQKWSLSANYEGTFEAQRKYTSLYCNLIKRF